jgi:hypothetical protein
MALFTDGPASAIEDLAAQDSQLLNVASAEGIDLTAKLALAQETVGIELEGLLQECSGPELRQVVITPALRLWHTYRTLETVYRDAFQNQLNDRYAGKRDQFRELGMWARERLRQTGVGSVQRPIPRAATPDVQPASGSLPEGTYYATAAWLNAAGEEGCAAIPASVTTASGGGFLVVAPAAPEGAAGWNVYAGTSPETMARQNGVSLDPGASWLQTGIPAGGSAPGDGQKPNQMHPLPRMLQRG